MVEDSWLQEAVQWSATPKDLREPKTAKEFYEKRGIPERTFYDKTAKTEFKQRVIASVVNTAKDEAPEIMQTLAEKAREGDMRGIEMYLKYVLELAEKMDLNVGVGDEERDGMKKLLEKMIEGKDEQPSDS